MPTAMPQTGPSRRAPRAPWSEKEVSQLVELWGMNLSKAEIARRLNRGEAAVAVKASRINLPPRNLAQNASPQARVRNCLRCSMPFHSSGSFHSSGFGNRICDPCKETQEWRNGDADCILIAEI